MRQDRDKVSFGVTKSMGGKPMVFEQLTKQ